MSASLRQFPRVISPRTLLTRRHYIAYKSPYGPKYQETIHVNGLTFGNAAKYAITGAGFGAAGLTFLLFFFAELPRVRKDIMQKVPILGNYFVNEVPPDENPF